MRVDLHKYTRVLREMRTFRIEAPKSLFESGIRRRLTSPLKYLMLNQSLLSAEIHSHDHFCAIFFVQLSSACQQKKNVLTRQVIPHLLIFFLRFGCNTTEKKT